MPWPERVVPRACVVWFVMLATCHTGVASAQPASNEEMALPAAPSALPEPPRVPLDAPTLAPPVALPTAGPTPASGAQVATLDYVDGSSFLRAFNDSMVLMPSGRMHIDTYAYAGKGVDDYHRANETGLTTQIFFRRFVLEAGGLIGKYWFWWMGGSFVPLQLDSSQALVANAGVYDGIVGFKPLPIVRIYFGQFNAPITMENVTSSRWLDLMERALLVRTIAIPENKAIGPVVWGETKHQDFEYQFGGLSADGTIGRPSVDGHYNIMGRFLVRPLARREGALNRFHLGGSFRYGKRDPRFLIYDAPSMSTPGGYTYWSSTYGEGDARTAIIPDRRQAVVAAEGYLPFQRWDIRSEFAWTHQERREALSSDRTSSPRGGLLHGYGIYAQLSVWLTGTPRINGNPGSTYGIIGPPQPKERAPYALQLVLRGEAIRLHYDGNSRFGSPGMLDTDTTRVRVNAYQGGVNFWATKHVRLTAQYSLYQFPGDPREGNQAVAPGVQAGTSPGAHFLSEVSFRVGLAL